MEGRHERDTEKKYSAAEQGLDSFICRFTRRWIGYLDTEFIEDCRLEVGLLLWRIRNKVNALPEAEQKSYIFTCTRNLLQRLLQREQRHRSETALYGNMCLSENVDKSERGKNNIENRIFADNWLSNMQNPNLAEILSSLPRQHYLLLELYYNENMTDAEIAQRLHLSAAAVRKQRNRIIAKLRQTLKPEGIAARNVGLQHISTKCIPPSFHLS